jgi:hypothetical protein
MDPTNGHTTAKRLAADVAGAEENVDHHRGLEGGI